VRAYRNPDGTVVIHVKDADERRVERITTALLVLWLGAMLIWPDKDQPEGLTPLGFGAILLGSALYQRLRGWHAGILSWVLGAVLIGVGIGDLVYGGDVPWFGIAVALSGLWLLARASRRGW
jgi:hypothetical protein